MKYPIIFIFIQFIDLEFQIFVERISIIQFKLSVLLVSTSQLAGRYQYALHFFQIVFMLLKEVFIKTQIIHNSLCFESFVTDTWRIKFEIHVEKSHKHWLEALFSPHLTLYWSISGAHLVKRFLQKYEFFSKLHGRRLCSGESMLTK